MSEELRTDINTEEKETLSLEEMFAKLEGVINEMQTGGLTLEETFARYKEGLALVENCNKKIEKIECDIKVIDPDWE